MKSLLLVAAMILPLASQAEVKAPGTFVPTLCSSSSFSGMDHTKGVKSVCSGHIVGGAQSVLRVVMNSGEVRVFSLQHAGRTGGGLGHNKSTFQGANILNSEETISGEMSITNGITVTGGINFTTNSGLSFRGPMQIVFTTL